MSRLGNRIIADGPFAAGGRTPGWLWAPVASDFNELRDELIYLRGPRSFVPVPTDEMKADFRAAQEQRAAELVAEGAPLGVHDILDRGLAAVLAIVERDHIIETSKLRGALTIAGKSRELWRQRALDLGYGGGPCEHPARSADDTEEKS